MTSMVDNPEKKIEGTWKESTWEYEKVDKNDTVSKDFKNVSNYVKGNIHNFESNYLVKILHAKQVANVAFSFLGVIFILIKPKP